MAPAIVLLHGFTHTGRSWDPVRAALGERYRALAPDIRGHGTAAAVGPVTLEGVLGDVADVAPEWFTLVGYSMGGRIALHAALALKDRVASLVLIGASPGIADPALRAARRARDEALADRIEASSIEEFAREWGRLPVLSGQPPSVVASAHMDRLRSQPKGLAAALRGLGQAALPPLWDRLVEVRAPVTLVVGENDEMFRATATRMLEAFPDAELAIVQKAGHSTHMESPRRIASLIAASVESGKHWRERL